MPASAAGGIIVAPATAWGEGAIAIVRLSGEGSVALADRFFDGRRPLASEPARKLVLGRIRGVDTVLAVRYERGLSYTGEESAEIHCHGGSMPAAECVRLFEASGARIAEPGEFTRRAFLNGRIDLAQTEAVLGVIKSRSAEALAASHRAMNGELTREIRRELDTLTSLRAEAEARLDFPDDTDGGPGPEELAALIEPAAARIRAFSGRCAAGSALRDGAVAAIVGPPNAGKSSLLNAMSGRDRSIVTDIPGTTRDTVEAEIVRDGLPITLIDTAGLREAASDEAERLGIERSLRAAEGADIVIAASDASAGPASVSEVLSAPPGGGCLIAAINKADLLSSSEREAIISKISDSPIPKNFTSRTIILVSAKTGEGVSELLGAIREAASRGVPLSEGFGVSARAASAVRRAAECAELAVSAARELGDAGAAAAMLASAAELLASPLGADAGEELLDAIFSNFCVGK